MNTINTNTQSYYSVPISDTKAVEQVKTKDMPQQQAQTSAKLIGSLNGDTNQTATLQKALENANLSSLAQEVKKLNTDLEVNWSAVVDPGGKIYARTYVESLVKQYETVENSIKEYYAAAHKDNLAQGSKADAMNYLALKYTKLGQEMGSPHYRADMSAQERQMALMQERALLLGGHVTLADPFALAASGGILNGETVESIAKQAAQDKINALITEYQKSKGIEATNALDMRI